MTNGGPSGSVTHCEFSLICRAPTVENAKVTEYKPTYEVRENITIDCNPDHSMANGQTKAKLQCNPDGTWNATIPTCDSDSSTGGNFGTPAPSQVTPSTPSYAKPPQVATPPSPTDTCAIYPTHTDDGTLFDGDVTSCVTLKEKIVPINSVRTTAINLMGSEIQCNPSFGEISITNSRGPCYLIKDDGGSCLFRCDPGKDISMLVIRGTVCEIIHD